MDSLELLTGYPTVHLDYNKIYIYVVEAKIVTP